MTSDSTYGAKNSSRNTARPRSRWLSNRAMPSAIGSWTVTDNATSSRPRCRSPMNTLSENIRVKLPSPTKLVGGPPRPFQLNRLVYIATRIGASTNRANSTSAGRTNSAIDIHSARRPGRWPRGAVTGSVAVATFATAIGRYPPWLWAVDVIACATSSGLMAPAMSCATLSLIFSPTAGG